MGLANVKRLLAPTVGPTVQTIRLTPNSIPVPGPVTILKHCRCIDCRRFHKTRLGDYYCDSLIGGTRIVCDTLERYCDPPPDAWHYCRDYRGPRVSKDVFVWKYDKTSPGSAAVCDSPTLPIKQTSRHTGQRGPPRGQGDRFHGSYQGEIFSLRPREQPQ